MECGMRLNECQILSLEFGKIKVWFHGVLTSFCRKTHDFFGWKLSRIEKNVDFSRAPHRDTRHIKQFCDRN